MRYIITLVALFISLIKVMAQDPQFTQLNNTLLLINPANVGSEQENKVQFNHRGQWLGLPSYFITSSFSAEFYLPEKTGGKQRTFRNSGLGIIAINDISGSTNLRNNYLAGLFSTEVRINPALALRSGIQFGIGNRSFNTNGLVFGDMLTPNGISGVPTQDDEVEATSIFYPDLGSGLLLYSPTWSLGVSLHHLNQPNYSINSQNAKLPIKFASTFSFLINLDPTVKTNQAPKQFIRPFIMYKAQGKYDQLDLGSTINLNPLILGLWYRGLLLKKEGRRLNNQDAVSIYVGSKWDRFQVGSSYDLTVSSLGSATAGSYEVFLSYTFGKPKSINGFSSSGARGVECESFPGGTGVRKFLKAIKRKKK